MHKSTQTNGERLMPGSDSGLVPTSAPVLDKLEQLPREKSDVSIFEAASSTLYKRARSKYVTNIVARPLAELKSPLQKAYKLSTTCAGELVERPGKISSMYCGCRWCVVCSRIRTGKLINGYMPAIEQMPEKWFLTLSRPNVLGVKLADEIKGLLHTASLIQRKLRERSGLQFSSIRKIECTYNEVDNTYHPHFHYIFDSWEAANATLEDWLRLNPKASRKANLLKKADNGSVKELFKYFTKVASKTKSKAANGIESSEYRIHLEALDCMFVAMRRVRTFQPCGVIKAVSEEIEPEQALESGRAQVNQWAWSEHDWMNTETAAALTGYVPTARTREIEGFVVHPKTAPLTGYVDRETGEVLDLKYEPQLRNSMRYAKIFDAPDELAPTTRRKLSSLSALGVVSVDWESQRQELELPAPAPVPVPAEGPKMAPELPLFAQPEAASGGAGEIVLLPALRAAARPADKILLSARKTTERKARPRSAQVPPLALTSDSSLFSNMQTASS